MRRSRVVMLLFAAVAVCYSVTAFVGHHQSTDTVATFSPAWQLAHHGNLWLDQVAVRSDWLVSNGTHWVSARFPGAILVTTPFYLLASGGSSAPTVGPSLVASVLCAAGAIAVIFVVADRLVDRRTALAAALLGAFGTATWNVSAAAIWTHGPAQLALALTLLALLSGRTLAAGFAVGAAVVIRPPLAVVAVVLLVALALRHRSWRSTVPFLPGPAIALGVLLAYNALVFGRVGLDSGYGESGARNVAAGPLNLLGNLPGVLVSPGRGLLILTPVLLVLLPGLASGWRRSPAVTRDCAVAGLAYLLVELWLLPFTGADGFYGYRLPLESLVLWLPVLVMAHASWVTTPRRRILFGVAAAISVAFESVAAWLHHPPLLAPDAWGTFMPERAVALDPAVAVAGAAMGVLAVVGWVLAGRMRLASSVRTE